MGIKYNLLDILAAILFVTLISELMYVNIHDCFHYDPKLVTYRSAHVDIICIVGVEE